MTECFETMELIRKKERKEVMDRIWWVIQSHPEGAGIEDEFKEAYPDWEVP